MKSTTEPSDPFHGTSAATELKRAYLLLDYEAFDEALEACARARDRAPGHPLPATLEGAIHGALGNFSTSIRILRRVTRAHPEFALAHVHLAESLLISGKVGPGRRALKEARECDDDAEHAEFIELLEACSENFVGQ